jgi:hypothetical protein
MPRWLLGLLVVGGLFAMHGITASAASAAAPCGVTAPHDHQAASGAPGERGPTLASPDVAGGHEGALCLAVLVGGLVLGLLTRRRNDDVDALRGQASFWAPSASGRSPPTPLLPLLCVSRT